MKFAQGGPVTLSKGERVPGFLLERGYVIPRKKIPPMMIVMELTDGDSFLVYASDKTWSITPEYAKLWLLLHLTQHLTQSEIVGGEWVDAVHEAQTEHGWWYSEDDGISDPILMRTSRPTEALFNSPYSFGWGVLVRLA